MFSKAIEIAEPQIPPIAIPKRALMARKVLKVGA